MSRDQYRYMNYENPATLNLYAYAWNNPLRYFDFDGHESIGEKSYLERSLEMVVLGNFSEESNLLGLAGGIVLSAFGGDIVMDVRDLVADLTVNADPTSLAWWGTIVLDIVAFVPLVGVVKYFDDVVDVFKKAFKAVDGKIDDILKASKKYLSSAKSGLESLTKKLGDIGNNIWNRAQDGWNRLMKVFKKGDKVEFTTAEIENLKNTVINEAQVLKDMGLTNTQLGPAIAGAYNKTTGKIYTAINDYDGKIPSELAPLIKERIENMPPDVYNSYIKTKGAGSHAEVYAVNKLLLDNPDVKMSDIAVYVNRTLGTSKPVIELPFETCPHCKYILEGINIISNK